MIESQSGAAEEVPTVLLVNKLIEYDVLALQEGPPRKVTSRSPRDRLEIASRSPRARLEFLRISRSPRGALEFLRVRCFDTRACVAGGPRLDDDGGAANGGGRSFAGGLSEETTVCSRTSCTLDPLIGAWARHAC